MRQDSGMNSSPRCFLSVQPNGSGYGGTMILNARSNNPRYKVVYVVNA